MSEMKSDETSEEETLLVGLEVGQWAYDTCKQFYMSSTVSSSSGNHRIVKLGSCWGGWGGQGQNPSYHAPGVYRLCRNYMKSHDVKYGETAQEGENFESRWNKLISTTYKMFGATQCDSTGLIPNWAKIYEEGQSLRAEMGFSGSGTPGAEYGSEASRAVWRVALDFLLFPNEAGEAVAWQLAGEGEGWKAIPKGPKNWISQVVGQYGTSETSTIQES